MDTILNADRKELLAYQLNSLKFVKDSLNMCCNHMMGCRDEAAKQVDAAYKLARFMYLDERVREALYIKDIVIYFDVDGITLDWRKEILKHYPEFKNIDEFNKHPKKDQMVRAAYEHDVNFFLNIEFHKLAASRIQDLVKRGYDVRFLTATGDLGDQRKLQTDKLIVMTRYLKENVDNETFKKLTDETRLVEIMNFVTHSADKAAYAGPDKILVDDYSLNINQWEEAGGIGILVDTEHLEEAEAWKLYDRVTDGRLRITEHRHPGRL